MQPRSIEFEQPEPTIHPRNRTRRPSAVRRGLRWIGLRGIVCLGMAVCSWPAAAQVEVADLAALKARTIGPAVMSGRVAAVEALPSDPNTIYVGAATGGLWKTTNGGLDWTPLFDRQDVHSIGAIAIHPRAPQTVWVGTGEGNPRNSASVGNGIYRSRDGGRTWKFCGLAGTERIHRIRLHPHDPDVAYVGAMGTTWGENPERGVFKTTDGGETWSRILFVDERTGCADLEMDPRNPDKLIAALWDHRRWPWFFRSGGPGSGLYVTYDGGKSWSRKTDQNGLPKGELGRMGLAIAPSSPNIVYAYVEAKENAVYRSDDGGESWRRVSEGGNAGNRPFYYADLRVDTLNPERIYSLWSVVSVSIDGGRHWEVLVPFGDVHPDHHALWIHPEDPRHLINGNDGGIAISRDAGTTWRFVRNLPLGQFYHMRTDLETPYNIYGGLQDNGSWVGPSSVWENGGIRNHHWQEVCFGDGFDTVPDPEDPKQGYAMSQEGFLVRWDLRTGERRSIRPVGRPGVDLRFNWNAAIALDPHRAGSLYFGSQFVHRSRDRGESWEFISPDLTTNNPEWQKQAESGGLTPDVTGAENFTALTAIAPSPLDEDVIWAGSDDGRVHVTRDGGETWTSVEGRVPDVPANTWVPQIIASRFSSGSAYVIFDDHRRANWTPYVYRTTDYGRTWRNIASSGVEGYCLSMVEDLKNPSLLFLGTEFGLWVTFDGGESWSRWNHGIPHASVMDLDLHPREQDLIVATHGRSVFIVDDIRSLRGLTDAVRAKSVHFFEPAPAQQYWVAQSGSSRFAGAEEFRGQNRPYGAFLDVWIGERDLRHPDADRERQRLLDKKAAALRVEARADSASAEPETSAKPEVTETRSEVDAKRLAKEKRLAKDKPLAKDKARITVTTMDGEKVRTWDTDVHQGLNRIRWNLRGTGYRGPSKSPPGDNAPDPRGWEVLPGQYRVTVAFRDQEEKSTVQVLADPRFSITLADRRAKDRARRQVGQLTERLAKSVQRIRQLREDLGAVKARVRASDLGDASGEFDEAEKRLREALGELEAKLWRSDGGKGITDDRSLNARVRSLGWPLGSSWAAPTESQTELIERLSKEVEETLSEVDSRLESLSSAVGKALEPLDIPLWRGPK